MNTRAIISAAPCPRRISNASSANRNRPMSSPRTMRAALTASSQRWCSSSSLLRVEFRVVGIPSKGRDFAALEFLLHVLPVLDAQQIAIFFAETAARVRALELHAVLELFGQEDHSVLEKPFRHRFLAGLTPGIGADLHIGQFFDRVIVEQEHPAVSSDSVVSRVQVLVEYIGGGIVANAMSEAHHHGAGRIFIGGLLKHPP